VQGEQPPPVTTPYPAVQYAQILGLLGHFIHKEDAQIEHPLPKMPYPSSQN